jgi:2-polyprenyl-3-methyl-5-hydroxy-6-metoxy-1,4-benzoquinol methylase
VPERAEDADVETSSEGYALRFGGSVGRFFLEVQARATLALLEPWPRGRVLDVGGGHAQLTGPLVDAGYDVTIYGSSPACATRVHPWTEPGRARFEAGDLLQAPFPDQAFDAVLCYRLLPHVTRWPGLLGELARLARHVVLVDYPTSRSVNAVAEALFGLKKRVEGDTRPFRVFRDAEVVEALAASGFHPTGRKAQFLVPMALHRALHAAPVSRGLEGIAAALGLTRAFGSPVIARLERRG